MQKHIVYIAILLIGICGTLGLKFLFQPSNNQPTNIDNEMISFLQEYIRIDTTHPTPHYKKAVSFLQKHANSDGFLYQEITLPSGKPVLIITYPGIETHKKSLMLNHHMDVVPAINTADWITPPFEGTIVDGVVIGRGAQDMKGIAAVHYYALKALKLLGKQPKRTIHICAVPDEEIGGFTGTKELIETDQFKKLNVGYVLDEGHASGNPDYFDLKIAERKPMQIQVTCKGELSHGSRLQCFNAIHELIAFLQCILDNHKDSQQSACSHAPGTLLSMNITSLTAGVRKENNIIALNIVPDCAQATIDIRIPPTMKRAAIKTMLDQFIAQHTNMTYTVLAEAVEEPELLTEPSQLYKALEKTIEKFGLGAHPHFFEATTDLRFYLAQGIDGVGFTPFTARDAIHETNESISVEQLIRARKIMEQFIYDFCA